MNIYFSDLIVVLIYSFVWNLINFSGQAAFTHGDIKCFNSKNYMGVVLCLAPEKALWVLRNIIRNSFCFWILCLRSFSMSWLKRGNFSLSVCTLRALWWKVYRIFIRRSSVRDVLSNALIELCVYFLFVGLDILSSDLLVVLIYSFVDFRFNFLLTLSQILSCFLNGHKSSI